MMSTLWTILKTDIINSFSINRIFGKHSKSRAKSVLIIIGAILIALFVEGYLFSLAFVLGAAAKTFDVLFIIVGLAFIIETLWSFITSVRLSSTYLFRFKDFDTLMSMPITPSIILTEKILKFYITNLISTIAIMFPFLTVYGILSGSGFVYYFLSFLIIFFVPMIPIVVGSIISFPLVMIASRFGKADLLNTIFTVIITVLSLVLSMSASNISNYINFENISINKELLWSYISKYPPAKWFTISLTDYRLTSALLFIAVSIAIFLVFVTLFKSMFQKTNSLLNENSTTKSYKFSHQKESSAFGALVKLEIKKFFSSYLYVINTCIGAVMCIFFSVSFVLNDIKSYMGDLNIDNSVFSFFVMIFGIALLSFMPNIAPTTSSSISIEGKKIWIIKTMPIKTQTLFMSKCIVNFIIHIPAIIISTIIISLTFELSLVQIVLLILIPTLNLVICTFFGLYINLLLPKINWTNPQQVVKQSMSVFLSSLVPFILLALSAVYIIFLVVLPVLTSLATTTGSYIMMFAWAVILSIVAILIWFIINKSGKKILHAIE